MPREASLRIAASGESARVRAIGMVAGAAEPPQLLFEVIAIGALTFAADQRDDLPHFDAERNALERVDVAVVRMDLA